MIRAMRVLFLLLALAIAVPAPAADLTVDAASDYLIDATINGQPVRLRVDPATSGYIILNAATVQRLGLRRSLLRSQTRIGPVRLTGGSKVAEVSIGGVTGDRRLVWLADRPAVDGADGVIGPADMHYDRVNFTIGPPGGGERAIVLPMQFERSMGLYFPLRIGEQEVRFKFALLKADTMATAGAGAHLFTHYGGSWSGEARDQVIHYGVVRPVRPLTLGRPVSLGGLELSQLLVRTGDNRGNLSLPPEPDADPEEVFVMGASRQRAQFHVTVGMDRLGRCSGLIWDNRARRLTLNCSG